MNKENTNIQPTQENIEDEESIPAGTKYSVVLRFWSTPEEIAVTNIVLCEDKITKYLSYKFIDSIGRLWNDVPFSDVILIKNYPDKEDISNFSRLEHDSMELNKQQRNIKHDIRDVNIG